MGTCFPGTPPVLLIWAMCCPHTFRGWLLSRSPPRGSPRSPWGKQPHQPVTSHLTRFYFLMAFIIIYSYYHVLHVCWLAFSLPRCKQRPFSSCFQYQAQSGSYLLHELIILESGLFWTACVVSSIASPLVCQPLQPCSTFFKEVDENYQLHFLNTGNCRGSHWL